MILKRALFVLALLLTVAQSFAASTSVSDFHCQPTEQLQLDCYLSSIDTDSHHTDLIDGHNCCHCHGNAHLFVPAASQRLLTFDQQNNIQQSQPHYYKLFLSQDTPPPIV